MNDETPSLDLEGMQIDIADALGKGAAVISIQAALIGMLISKKILTEGDAGTLTGVASQGVSTLEDLSDEARELGQAALRGFAKTYMKHVTKN